MKLKIKEGTVDKLIRVFLQDSTSTTGGGLTGLTSASTNLKAYWIAEGDSAPTELSLSGGTVGTHSAGGFIQVHATNMPGIYEIGLTDAMIDATSQGSVLLYIFEITTTALNLVPCIVEIELDKIDYRNTAWANMMLSGGQIYAGTVDYTNFTATDSAFSTSDITTAAADHWIGRVVIFTSGTLIGQASDIIDYVLDTGDGKFTVTTLTSAPANGVTFIII